MKIKQVKLFHGIDNYQRIEKQMNNFIKEYGEDIVEINPITVSSYNRGQQFGAIFVSSIVYLEEIDPN